MSKRLLLAGVVALGAAVLITAGFGRSTHAVTEALAELGGASPVWLAAAASAFLAASLASAAAWHRGLGASGARLGRWQVTQRYAAGCLANTLAPANAGEFVRVALLSRAMGSEGAVFTVVGVSAVVAAVRISVVAALFAVTAASGSSMLWFGVAIGPAAILAFGALRLARGHTFSGRVRHVLDVVGGLATSPRAAVEIVAWVVTATAATILASACVGAALGVPHPLAAALVIVPAIQLARLLPLTPGNVGLTSAAVAIALHGRGVPMESAAAAGIAFHAVETVVGLTIGAVGTLSLAPRAHPWPAARLWLRPRIGRAVAAAGPVALLLAVVISAIGAHAALT